KGAMLGVYGVLGALALFMFHIVPSGFIPQQDKAYLVGMVQLPDGATLDRTEAVVRKAGEIALKQPGVAHAVQFPGLSINGFTISSSSAVVFLPLKPFHDRHGAALSAGAIAGALNQQFAGIKEANVIVFPPPPLL